jgi:hypothetical protein
MSDDPKDLLVLQSRSAVLRPFWPVLLGLPQMLFGLPHAMGFFRDWTDTLPSWIIAGCVALACVSVWSWRKKPESRKYVIFNEAGVWVSKRPGGVLPWSYVEACASKNERGLRILRLFPRAEAPPAAWPKKAEPAQWGRSRARLIKVDHVEPHFDIDFSLAEEPEQSLANAFAACVSWIAAKRDSSVTSPPIRDFGDYPRMSTLFVRVIFVAAISLALVVAFAYAILPRHRTVLEEPPDVADDRPGQSVLFLGNSRIGVYNLPRVVREVADSAHSPIRYDVQMRIWGGATLKGHWQDDGDQQALKKPWAYVILQSQSAAFANESGTRDFDDYGQRLIKAAQDDGARAALISNWTLGPTFFNGVEESLDGDPKSYGDRIHDATRALAESTGAGVIELERAFADAGDLMPEIPLTSDGNHPTPAGTFLSALVVYRYLSHDDLDKVTWRPYDMSVETAAKFKRIAVRYAK